MNAHKKVEINYLMETVNDSSTTSTDSSSEQNDLSLSFINTSSTSEEDDECILLFPILKYLISGCKRHRVKNYLDIVDSWTDLEFKEHLRIERTTANKLIDKDSRSRWHLETPHPRIVRIRTL
ncbi:hypothetical protein PUN28_020912 [Cardiocondyla obscurior]|uniref:Uncharacterized protein n=1 Tax=Cardiocondyla obscurior TaxID=286306 RepID=A0AAW2E6R7_9HYME